MKDWKTNFAPFNQLRLCLLELGKFKKKETELSGMLDKWLYFLKEAEGLDVRPKALKERPFVDAFEKAQVVESFQGREGCLRCGPSGGEGQGGNA